MQNKSNAKTQFNRALENAAAVFGDEQKARNWLLKTNEALGGVTPISLLESESVFQQTMDTLKRIERGVYS